VLTVLPEGEAADARARVQDLIKQVRRRSSLTCGAPRVVRSSEAVAVANLFNQRRMLAQTSGREGKTLKTFAADPKAAIFSGPVVAVIDNGTAGAAEVVASALLERQSRQVVGEKSFGAGAEQQLFTLRGGDWLIIDHGQMGVCSGKSFWRGPPQPLRSNSIGLQVKRRMNSPRQLSPRMN